MIILTVLLFETRVTNGPRSGTLKMSISLVGCAKSSIFSHQPQRSQPSNSFNPPNLMNSTPLHLLSPTTLLQQSTIYKLAVEIVSCFSSSFFFNVFFFCFLLSLNQLIILHSRLPCCPLLSHLLL